MKKPVAIVTVKDKYQIVIPQAVRQQLGISLGDMLEARVERGKITCSPKVLVDRLREIAPTPPALKAMQEDARRKGTDKLTMREINAEIAAACKEARKKK
jgi:AbrB family looped-hinge helix DNA binding protein